MKEKQALSYLMKNRQLNIGMIEIIKRGTADILYANVDGVLLIDKKSKACMLSVDNFELGKELLSGIDESSLVMLHQEFMYEYALNKFNLQDKMICFTAIYNKENKFNLGNELEIKSLDETYIDVVMQHYKILPREALMSVIEDKSLFGGFKDCELVGFIGNHGEGTIGLLEILPEHRRKGYATMLEHFMVSRMSESGLTAFAHIDVDNSDSVRLHKKLGFDITEERIFWLF
ncbi:MAG: GNAT family N-acetyltransferase [Sarcina sp.]